MMLSTDDASISLLCEVPSVWSFAAFSAISFELARSQTLILIMFSISNGSKAHGKYENGISFLTLKNALVYKDLLTLTL